MAENTNHEPAEDDNEPSVRVAVVRIAIPTPFGTTVVDVADLPAEVREMLIENIRSGDMPDVMRDALCKALDIDPNNLPEPAHVTESEPDTAAGDANAAQEPVSNPDKAPQDGHAPGCNCAEQHRENVWRILDAAFPQEPHLWKATESLFELSALNPHEISDSARRAALNDAALHIKRHTDLAAPPLSPLEQMVEKFRIELEID
jgi:hypothetical protein